MAWQRSTGIYIMWKCGFKADTAEGHCTLFARGQMGDPHGGCDGAGTIESCKAMTLDEGHVCGWCGYSEASSAGECVRGGVSKLCPMQTTVHPCQKWLPPAEGEMPPAKW